MKKSFVVVIVILMAITIKASDEIGVVVGGMNGLSYKHWFSKKIALQVDAAVGLTAAPGGIYYRGYKMQGGTNPQYDFTVNPNIAFHHPLTENFKFYYGVGANFGLVSDLHNVNPNLIMGKFGLNTMLGLAYYINKVSFSLDFRPGYGLAFYNSQSPHFSFFDWKIGLAIRYCL